MADQPQTCCLTRGLAPVIWLFCIIRNNADVLPFTLRHYSRFCDRMFFWDDKSTDGTTEILKAHPKVTYRDWPYDTGLDDDLFLDFAYATYPKARGKADWCVWIDADEIIYHPDLPGVLTDAKADGYEAIKCDGYNMTHEGMPRDDGRQIWEICRTGTPDSEYGKPTILRPEFRVRWVSGKHRTIDCNPRIFENSGIKLLHYRYLGYNYTKARCANNWTRATNKNYAWAQAPGHTGDHSPDWAARQIRLAKIVV